MGTEESGPPPQVQHQAEVKLTRNVTMEDNPHIPTLTDIALLPKWAKVMFLSRCAARVIPLIHNQWPALTDNDMMIVGMACANASASARFGREILTGADPMPRLLELIQAAEEHGNMAAYGLTVCACAAGLTQIELPETAAAFVAQSLERMVATYAANDLNEGAVVGSVWFDFVALRDAAAAECWADDDCIPRDVPPGELWPMGTPPGWPA